jgi:hypothetical protein
VAYQKIEFLPSRGSWIVVEARIRREEGGEMIRGVGLSTDGRWDMSLGRALVLLLLWHDRDEDLRFDVWMLVKA